MNLFVMIPTGKCDRTVFKEWGVEKLTSLVVQSTTGYAYAHLNVNLTFQFTE
ncbi:MAG: hypothetical protein V7L07_03740 [Nostoc sp.]